ncbi:Epidermal growth factor receptor kinase substrate 8-like protein 2 [Labeo rohita]|uniref:Epidermal growth factor receptor kinase substrate 8-like protein 2 n=1 Tax=Labeo rohita TaxID=84645 RepID=A0ABQ8LU68_LABRO|nr:Epidermal growth factor receptor kinase substrate 8-like protein 2 [Labeo rohita]
MTLKYLQQLKLQQQAPESNSDLQHVRIRYHFVARNANELTVQPGEVLEVRMTLCEEVEEDGERGRTGLRYTVWEAEEEKARLQLSCSAQEQPPAPRHSIYMRTTEVIKRDYPQLANPSGNTDNRVSRHARPEPGITGISFEDPNSRMHHWDTVLENNKQWRLLRNRSGQSGYVPCNVLEEVKPGEQQYNRAALFNSQAVNPYKGTSAGPVNHAEVLEMNKSSRDKDSTYLLSARCICCEMESGESLPKKCREVGNEFGRLFLYLSLLLSISLDRDQQKEVNDELLKRITDNKAQPPARNFRVERSSTSMPITYESQPFEVHAWLNAKGFSRPVVECLGILNGAQLFSLSKDELKAVCGDEGSRVFSQITVQKAQIERGRGDTELQEIMRRRQQEVEGSTWE